MNIEIQKPELEALILERMKSGGFQSVEDVLMQALKSAPPATESSDQPPCHRCRPGGRDAGFAI